MVRYSQKGMNLLEAKAVVDSVVKRRYPFIEEIDGRVYVDIARGAREAAILILWHVYPRRISEDDLFDQLRRHQLKKQNAEMAIKRIQGAVDNDNGNMKLRAIGIREAEELIEEAEKNEALNRKPRLNSRSWRCEAVSRAENGSFDGTEASIFRRDKWIRRYCHRPVFFHPAMAGGLFWPTSTGRFPNPSRTRLGSRGL